MQTTDYAGTLPGDGKRPIFHTAFATRHPAACLNPTFTSGVPGGPLFCMVQSTDRTEGAVYLPAAKLLDAIEHWRRCVTYVSTRCGHRLHTWQPSSVVVCARSMTLAVLAESLSSEGLPPSPWTPHCRNQLNVQCSCCSPHDVPAGEPCLQKIQMLLLPLIAGLTEGFAATATSRHLYRCATTIVASPGPEASSCSRQSSPIGSGRNRRF
jgi:hypothetical protein